jgi:hypothetical protein
LWGQARLQGIYVLAWCVALLLPHALLLLEMLNWWWQVGSNKEAGYTC